MRKLTEQLIQFAGRKTFALSIALYLVFGAGVMPWGASTFNQMSGKEVQVVDLQITGYDLAKANSILQEYSPEARIFAAKFGLIADSFYPLVYTWLYLIAFAWILKSSNKNSRLLQLLFVLPLITMLVDFVENHFIGQLMYSFPNITAEQVSIASLLTQTKWFFCGLQTIALIGLLLQLVVYRRQNRTAQ